MAADGDTTMATPSSIDFGVRINQIRNDLRRDQAENILLHRDADICQEDVQTRVGIGAADLQVREQKLVETHARHRTSFLEQMDECLLERIVGCKALIVRDAISDVEHDTDMLGMVETLATLKVNWSYFYNEMRARLATENERIRNEVVHKERFDQELYSGYTSKLETADRDIQRLKNAIRSSWDACMEGRRRNEKRKRIATDTLINTEFGCGRTAAGAAEFKVVTNFLLDDALHRSMRRANAMQDSLDIMARNVESFKYRDKRGLYKNVVYKNGRYRWRYTHRNRQHASRVSFHTIAEAMVSLMDDKSNTVARS